MRCVPVLAGASASVDTPTQEIIISSSGSLLLLICAGYSHTTSGETWTTYIGQCVRLTSPGLQIKSAWECSDPARRGASLPNDSRRPPSAQLTISKADDDVSQKLDCQLHLHFSFVRKPVLPLRGSTVMFGAVATSRCKSRPWSLKVNPEVTFPDVYIASLPVFGIFFSPRACLGLCSSSRDPFSLHPPERLSVLYINRAQKATRSTRALRDTHGVIGRLIDNPKAFSCSYFSHFTRCPCSRLKSC